MILETSCLPKEGLAYNPCFIKRLGIATLLIQWYGADLEIRWYWVVLGGIIPT